MMIPKEFYTYQFIDGDLIIYTWEYLELWGSDEAAYTHPAGGEVTYVTIYDDPETFERENDVFLSRIDATYHALGVYEEDVTVSLEEAKKQLEDDYEEQLNEFYDLSDDVMEEYDGAYKALQESDDDEVS
jgi:hypothetical protein